MRGVVLSGAFFIFWFLSLFCLLPIGLGGPVDPESGAPLKPRVGLKFLIATGMATVLWLVFYAVVLAGWVAL